MYSYDGSEILRKLPLDKHPEDRFFLKTPNVADIQYNGHGDRGPAVVMDHTAFTIAAARLGRTMRVLKEVFETGNYGPKAQKEMLLAVEHAVWDPPSGKPNLKRDLFEIARSLLPAGADLKELTKRSDAVQLIQDKVLEENSLNWEPVEPNLADIWGFAKDKEPPPEPYFSLRRWPVHFQTPEHQAEIGASGPHREAPVLTAEEEAALEKLEDELSDPRVRYIKGDAEFPFGETPFQRAVSDYQIEKQLGNGRSFRFLSIRYSSIRYTDT